MSRLAGVVAATIDGDSWDVVSDCEYDSTTVKREGLVGQTAAAGYSEMPKFGFISFTLRDRPDQTVYSLNQKTNSTVIVQLANNKTVYAYGAFQTGEISVATEQGTFQVRFESPAVVEATV